MPNITLSIDEKLLRESRKFAEKQGLSLNGLIRGMLAKTVKKNSRAWLDDTFKIADNCGANSGGWKFNRDEIHDR